MSIKEQNKVLAIDASNIRAGGGITHLSQFLSHLNLEGSMFSEVIVWSNNNTLLKLPDKPWLKKETNRLLNGNLFMRIYWQAARLTKSLIQYKCDLLFVPGGTFTSSFSPVVTMHQNLIPFEKKEIFRNGLSLMTLKWLLLRYTQNKSFMKSNGIIFLSEYSMEHLPQGSLLDSIQAQIIPHGIEERFFKEPSKQNSIDHYSNINPYRIIYVSTIDFYKHQWNLALAVQRLKEEGLPVQLEFYGSANPKALKKLTKVINQVNTYDEKDFVFYKGEASFDEIEKLYFSSDLTAFCSSCETFGQIVLEKMASGTPLICSNMSSLPEIVKDGALLMNPLDIEDVYNGLKKIICSKEVRTRLSIRASEIAGNYSWYKTSQQTLNFFEEIIKN